MLSVSGLAAPCFSFIVASLTPHTTCSWVVGQHGQGYLPLVAQTPGGLIRPNSIAAIAACEAKAKLQHSHVSLDRDRDFVEADDSVRVPNSKPELVQSAQWRTVYATTFSWESLLGQMPDSYGCKCGDWLDVEAEMSRMPTPQRWVARDFRDVSVGVVSRFQLMDPKVIRVVTFRASVSFGLSDFFASL